MERDTAKEAVRRLSRLESENLTLRQLLDTLTSDASHNEQVMHRFQERELALLGAADLPELIEALTTGLRKSFALESVQLVLFDPHEVLSELLSALGVSNGRLPHVRMERDVRRAMQRYPDLRHPWLGRWNPHHSPSRTGAASAQRDPAASAPVRRHRRLSAPVQPRPGTFPPRTGHRVPGTPCPHRRGVPGERGQPRAPATQRPDRWPDRPVQPPPSGRPPGGGDQPRQAPRHRHTLGCLFIDADHFKRINDEHGHAAGDRVLVVLAKRIREQLRGSDMAARYGGEEIAVLLPQTTPENACLLAERIRQHIADQPIQLPGGKAVPVTVSIGVAAVTPDRDSTTEELAAELLAQADRRVYAAKEAGRNRVCCNRK